MPKINQKPPNNLPKSSQNQQDGSKGRSCRLLTAKRLEDAPKTPGDIPNKAFWRRPGGFWGRLGPKRVANMAPSWPPKRGKFRLGAFWAVLMGSWAAHGPFLGRSIRLSTGRFGSFCNAIRCWFNSSIRFIDAIRRCDSVIG